MAASSPRTLATADNGTGTGQSSSNPLSNLSLPSHREDGTDSTTYAVLDGITFTRSDGSTVDTQDIRSEIDGANELLEIPGEEDNNSLAIFAGTLLSVEITNQIGNLGMFQNGQNENQGWQEGGFYKAAAHLANGALTNVLTGGDSRDSLSAGLSAAAVEMAMPYLSTGNQQTDQQIAGLFGGIVSHATGGDFDSGAISGSVAEVFNRQMHEQEIKAIRNKARSMAGQEGKSEEEWVALLTRLALRRLDARMNRLVADIDDASIKATANAALDQLADQGNAAFTGTVGNGLNFLRQDAGYDNALIFAGNILNHPDVYDSALGDHPATQYGLTGSQLALVHATKTGTGIGGFNDNLGEADEVKHLNPAGTELENALTLMQIQRELATIFASVQRSARDADIDYQALVKESEDNPGTISEQQLAAADDKANTLANTRIAAQSGLRGASFEYEQLIRSGVREGATAAAINALKAVPEAAMLLAMAATGDDASQAEINKAWEGLTWVLSHPDEVPATVLEGINKKLNAAQAAHDQGNLTEAGKIIGEMQFEVVAGMMGATALGTFATIKIGDGTQQLVRRVRMESEQLNPPTFRQYPEYTIGPDTGKRSLPEGATISEDGMTVTTARGATLTHSGRLDYEGNALFERLTPAGERTGKYVTYLEVRPVATRMRDRVLGDGTVLGPNGGRYTPTADIHGFGNPVYSNSGRYYVLDNNGLTRIDAPSRQFAEANPLGRPGMPPMMLNPNLRPDDLIYHPTVFNTVQGINDVIDSIHMPPGSPTSGIGARVLGGTTACGAAALFGYTTCNDLMHEYLFTPPS